MATTETKVDETAGAAKAGDASAKAPAFPMIALVLTVMVAVGLTLAGAGGVVYWLAKSGKLPLQGGPAKVEAAGPPEPPKTHVVGLDPLLVNLADEGGHAYLRVTLSLALVDAPPVKGEKPAEEKAAKGKAVIEHDAEIRDAAFGIIGSETADALLAPDGKEQLKAALKKTLAARLPEMKVADVYFTEFLVQR